MKKSDKVLWFVWLTLIGLMMFKHEEQRAEIQRLNGLFMSYGWNGRSGCISYR